MSQRHKIQAGESVISISARYGFFAGTLWDHPDNAEVKTARRYMNVLAPGDAIWIPDLREKTLSCATGQRHVFRRRGVPALFRLRLLRDGEPRKQLAYRFIVEGIEAHGETNGDGMLEEPVANEAKEGLLYLGEDETPIVIRFGHLQPVETLSGIKSRLENLGYTCGPSDEEIDGQTRNALLAFQKHAKLKETGKADDETRMKLFQMHDEKT